MIAGCVGMVSLRLRVAEFQRQVVGHIVHGTAWTLPAVASKLTIPISIASGAEICRCEFTARAGLATGPGNAAPARADAGSTLGAGEWSEFVVLAKPTLRS